MTNDPLEHPGYHFQDELVRNLNNLGNPFGFPFNVAGVLAMDTVAPNQNGSRFFITAVAAPSLNGQYTAFGQVTNVPGLNVVRSIADSLSGVNGAPDEEMVILDIKFRRGGITANAFMEGYHQGFLPGKIETLPLSVEQNEDALELVIPLRPKSQNSIYSTSDLRSYLGGTIEAQSPEQTSPERIDLTEILELAPKTFFRGFSTAMPTWPSAEFELKRARLLLSATSGSDLGKLNMIFNEGGTGGTYSIDMNIEQNFFGDDPRVVRSVGAGTFAATYDFSRSPYLGVLKITSFTGPLNAEQFSLHFDSSRFTNNPQVNPATLVRRFDARTSDPLVPFLSYSGVFQKIQ
jgi:hypothetical protein